VQGSGSGQSSTLNGQGSVPEFGQHLPAGATGRRRPFPLGEDQHRPQPTVSPEDAGRHRMSLCAYGEAEGGVLQVRARSDGAVGEERCGTDLKAGVGSVRPLTHGRGGAREHFPVDGVAFHVSATRAVQAPGCPPAKRRGPGLLEWPSLVHTSDVAGRLPGAGVCAALLALALVNAAALRLNDFQVFHTAGGRVLRGESLYRSEDGRFPFKYAPVVGVLLAPVGALPLRPAKAVWEVASALALFLFLRHAAGLALPAPTPGRGALAFALLLPYLWHLFSLGQIDGFLLAAIALSERWAERHPVASGLLWALAALTKPPYLVFLAVALLARQGPRLLALVGWLVAGALAPVLVWGWERNLLALRAWWALLFQSTPDLLCSRANQSLWALACRYASPGWPATLAVVGLGTLALAGLTLWAARGAGSGARDAIALGCLAATALVTPLGWWTNFIALAPLVYGLLGTAATGDERWKRLVAGASAAGLAGVAVLTAELISQEGFKWWLEQKHYGIAALAATLAALVLRPAGYSQPMTTSSM
jgi:hypothetical protein